MELNYLKLAFTFTLAGNLPDPYALFHSRTSFEECFRHALSCRRGECRGCQRGGTCCYPATFGQEISSDPEAVRRHQKPPLPFVFQFPVLPPPPNRGAPLACYLTLFGSAVQHLDSYLAGCRELFARLPARLLKVEALGPGGSRSAVELGPAGASRSPLPLLGAGDPLAGGPLAVDRVTVELVTPLKLVQEGQALKEVLFSHFARALMRRVSAIAHYYGALELPLDYRSLARASEEVECCGCAWRYTRWGSRLSGVLGTATFRGNLGEFHLLLLLGEAMNLGKGASFGQGQFRLR